MKKAVYAAIAVCFAIMVFSGCGAEKKKLTLNVGVNTTLSMKCFADSDIECGYDFLNKAADDFESVYDSAELTVNVTEIDASCSDSRITGCFGTADAYDVLMNEFMSMSTYIHTGNAVPLDDIITEEIKGDIAEKYWTQSRYNGHVYLMPFLTMQNVLAYNKELFKSAGLSDFINDEKVTSWSLSEWDYILDTLAKKLPENVYPMMMYAADEQGDSHIMTLLRSRGCPLFDENGRFCVNCKEGVAALEWLKTGVEKGWFPPNAESMSILDNLELFLNGQLAIDLMNSNLESFSEDAGIDFGLVNFPSQGDKGLYSAFLTGFEVFDNNDPDKTAAAKAFVKYLYETDWLDYSAGSIPVSNKVRKKYAEELSDFSVYMNNSARAVDITGNNPNWSGVRAVFYPEIQSLLYGDVDAKTAAQRIDTQCNSAIDEGVKTSAPHD